MLLLVSLLVLGLAVPAFAAGQSDIAQIHPGHMGAVKSGAAETGDYKGMPTIHFHLVATYDDWGTLVSETAKMYKGIPNAHAMD